MADDWLTTREVAAKLGVNDSRVRQIILAGMLRARKFAGSWAIDPDDLAEYMKLSGYLRTEEKEKA